MERLQSLYETYLTEVREAANGLEPTDGLAGFGAGLAGAPCHDRFVSQFEDLMAEMTVEASSTLAKKALAFIYMAPLTERNQTVYWLLIAVHGMTLSLVSKLNRQDAGELEAQYARVYSRWERLPVQKKVLKALSERSH